MRETVIVPVLLYRDVVSRRLTILPSDAVLARQIRSAEMLEQEAQNLEDQAGFVPEGDEHLAARYRAEAQVKRDSARNTRTYVTALTEQREKLRTAPGSEQRTYTLIVPTEEARLNAETKARSVDTKTQRVLTDDTILRRELLPISVEGMEPSEVRELPAIITDLLWRELLACSYPDPDELLFFRVPTP